MKAKQVSKIAENTQIQDWCGRWYDVSKVYKTGVQYLDEWRNEYGFFSEKKFVTYEKLLTDEWTNVNTCKDDRYNTVLD